MSSVYLLCNGAGSLALVAILWQATEVREGSTGKMKHTTGLYHQDLYSIGARSISFLFGADVPCFFGEVADTCPTLRVPNHQR